MKARALFLAAFACLAFAPQAISAPDTVVNRNGAAPLIVPANSGLHYQSTDGDGTSKFQGRILISGTYYYELGEDADSTSLQIIPDRETIARLPHFRGYGAPNVISLSDAVAFAKAAKIAPHTKTARGKTQIWADRFEAGIECDVPFFTARFVELAQPPAKFAARDMDDNGC